jgi:hypothetical protein
LTTLQALLDATKGSKARKGGAAAEREWLQTHAGQQIRESSMKGNVRRETLVDISVIERATTREKQGQQKCMLVSMIITFSILILQ